MAETGGGRKSSDGGQRLEHRKRSITRYRRPTRIGLKGNRSMSSARMTKATVRGGTGRSIFAVAERLSWAPMALLAARCTTWRPLERRDATLDGKIPSRRRNEIRIHRDRRVVVTEFTWTSSSTTSYRRLKTLDGVRLFSNDITERAIT